MNVQFLFIILILFRLLYGAVKLLLNPTYFEVFCLVIMVDLIIYRSINDIIACNTRCIFVTSFPVAFYIYPFLLSATFPLNRPSLEI